MGHSRGPSIAASDEMKYGVCRTLVLSGAMAGRLFRSAGRTGATEFKRTTDERGRRFYRLVLSSRPMVHRVQQRGSVDVTIVWKETRTYLKIG